MLLGEGVVFARQRPQPYGGVVEGCANFKHPPHKTITFVFGKFLSNCWKRFKVVHEGAGGRRRGFWES